MKEIFERRSIRTYQDATVEKEKVERLLRAAMQAPSAMNQKPRIFYWKQCTWGWEQSG